MIDAFFVLALMAIAMLIAVAVVLLKVWKQAGRRRLASASAARASSQAAGGSYSEPETRFLESARKSQYRLLNTSEQALYHRLVEAMPSMTVFCQVGIAQLVQLRGQHAVEEIRELIGRSINFLVCRDDFSIVAAVDLIWPTDEEPERQKAAESKRLALEKLEIPLIVYRPQQLPSVDTLAREIAGAILRQNRPDAKKTGT